MVVALTCVECDDHFEYLLITRNGRRTQHKCLCYEGNTFYNFISHNKISHTLDAQSPRIPHYTLNILIDSMENITNILLPHNFLSHSFAFSLIDIMHHIPRIFYYWMMSIYDNYPQYILLSGTDSSRLFNIQIHNACIHYDCPMSIHYSDPHCIQSSCKILKLWA